VGLDDSEKSQGEHSLRIRFTGVSNVPTVKASDVAPLWAGIERSLEDNRATYKKNGRTDVEIDWVIQNARVAEQAMLMLSNSVPRDESMARNIQWILKQNPDAKVVVWAHNGHVANSTIGGSRSMGAALREALGKQMVIFGFAFHQGSFQAIENGKGLREFTVGPAPEGSLDAALSGAQIPLFALDLRSTESAPAEVRDWWRVPHQTRSIGALYADAGGPMYFANQIAPETYDVLLFVEKTTQARKNAGR
jgi:erythromycin esterase